MDKNLPETAAHAATAGAPWHGMLRAWLRRLRETDELLTLDARERRDIGLDLYDIRLLLRGTPRQD